MKKVLSVFMALVMMLSLAIISFAADNIITVGVKKTVTVSTGWDEALELSFTAPARDIYNVKLKLLNDSSAICDVNYYVADEDYYSYVDGCSLFKLDELEDYLPVLTDEGDVNFVADRGSEFCISLYLDDFDMLKDEGVMPDAKVEVTVTRCNAPTLKTGVTKIAADGRMFIFVPDKDGVYNFVSDGKDNVDPYINVCDIAGCWSSSDDNGYEDDLNFDLSGYFYKGQLYAVYASEYDMDDIAPKAYSMTVTYNKKQVAERIELYADDIYGLGEDTLRIYKGEFGYADITIVPTGAKYNAGVKAYTENEKIATCEGYDEGFDNIAVYGNRVGTTKLVVTTPEGVSAELKVKVVPSFFYFFDNLFYTIRNFFFNLFFGALVD